MITIEIPWLDEWPRCYYNPEAFCGEPQEKSIKPHWVHVCECPSCPITVAVRDRARKERRDADNR